MSPPKAVPSSRTVDSGDTHARRPPASPSSTFQSAGLRARPLSPKHHHHDRRTRPQCHHALSLDWNLLTAFVRRMPKRPRHPAAQSGKHGVSLSPAIPTPRTRRFVIPFSAGSWKRSALARRQRVSRAPSRRPSGTPRSSDRGSKCPWATSIGAAEPESPTKHTHYGILGPSRLDESGSALTRRGSWQLVAKGRTSEPSTPPVQTLISRTGREPNKERGDRSRPPCLRHTSGSALVSSRNDQLNPTDAEQPPPS